jgi:hypothetical protein
MSTSPGVLAAVRWNELCPWLLLVRAARAALMVRVLALALVGVALTQWGWKVVDYLVLKEPRTTAPLAWLSERPAPALWGGPSVTVTPPADVLTLPPPAADDDVRDSAGAVSAALDEMNRRDLFNAVDARRYSGPLMRGWAWALQPLDRLIDGPGWRPRFAFAFAGLWALAVWGLVGGAISRIAALYLTRGETIGPIAALRAAGAKWMSTFAAPLFCLIVIVMFTLLLILAGAIIRLGPLAFLAGLAWPIALLVGIAVAIFGIGLVAGWPMMWSTVAVERTDAFDGVSRGYAFTYQRPLHFVFFVMVATVLGLLAQAAVSLVVDAALNATWWGVRHGAGQARADALLAGLPTIPRDDLGIMARAGGNMMRFWSTGLASVATSFPMAYLWTAAAGIYLLLRRLIDSTELGEVAFDEGAPEQGLPPLATDSATGVPTMQPTAAEPSATVSELRGGST